MLDFKMIIMNRIKDFMLKKIIILLIGAVLAGLFGFTFFSNQYGGNNKNKIIEDIVFSSLKQAHYNPITLDDKFSAQAFDLYIKRLDPNKRYFLQEDIDKLSEFKNQIDDEINGSQPINLLPLTIETYKKRVEKCRAFYTEILSKPFDFTSEEEIELDGDKKTFAKTEDELKDEWRKLLKYSALVRYYSKLNEQTQKTKDNPKTNEQIEAEVREQLLKNYNDSFDILIKQDEEDHFNEYMNALVGIYCPHTEYFAPQKKENFDMQMSGKLEGIGATLQQTEGKIKVAAIVPGSASWRQKELKESDIILKVGQGDAEPVSLDGMALKNAVKLIRGKKGTTVKLTVQKPDGRVVEIAIVRDVVILEESYAKSAVIYNKEDNKKYGIINLPTFYADFRDRNGRRCADDVKKELIKLKGQGVDAIMIDLRNNGGGSLSDVVEMAGFFIEDGAIVQVRNRNSKPDIHKDSDADVVYDGPLAIMVNKFSASASEIMAAAMQDYGRAIIVGSPTTFGKGTVQRFIELDDYINFTNSNLRPLGSLKFTFQKFYRITGESTQERGVVPDVILPDIYNELEMGEKDLPNVLSWDKIEKVKFTPWEKDKKHKGEKIKADKIAKKSEKRLKENEVFKLIEENAKRLKNQRDKTKISLNFARYKAEQEKLNKESERFKSFAKENPLFDISILDERDGNESDSVKIISAENWKKELKNDVYVNETVNILKDLMN